MTDLSQIRLSDDARRPRALRARTVVLGAVGLAGVGVLVLVAVLILGRGTSEDEEAAASARTDGRTSPATRTIRPASPGDTVTAGGYVEARRTSALLPSRDGVVSKVSVALGQRVEEGALVVELESASLAADVSVAEAELAAATAGLALVRSGTRSEEIDSARAEAEAAAAEQDEAEREVARLERLAGVVPAAEVERARTRQRVARARTASLRSRASQLQRGSRASEIAGAEAEVARARAALDRARASLEETRLRAPFTGVVVRLDVEPGEGLGPSTEPRVEIADLSELWVRVDVPETNVAAVELGAAAKVFVDAIDGEPLAASVVEVAPVADRQSNTVEVAVRIVDPPVLLRPNMSARVSIRREPGDG